MTSDADSNADSRGEPASPKQIKRKHDTHNITPDDNKRSKQIPRKEKHKKQKDISNWYGNKVLDASKYLRIDTAYTAINGLREPPLICFWKDVAYGMFTLFYVDIFMGKREGNVWPILKAYQHLRKTEKTKCDRDDDTFVKQTRFLGVFPRRVSKDQDVAILKNGKVDPSKNYPEIVFVASFPESSTSTQKKVDTVKNIVKFLSYRGIEAEVADRMVQTNRQVQSLDHYLRDIDILRLIRRFWKGKANKNFYEHNPVERDAFFSKPYPFCAVQDLGFPEIETDDIANDNIADEDVVDMTRENHN